MSIDQQLRQELHSFAKGIQVPAQVDHQVLHTGKGEGRRRRINVKTIGLGVAVSVLLLTAAVPVTFPADTLYGSFSKLQKKAASFTKQQYVALGMKLAGAQGKLGDEYPAFISNLKQITAVMMEYGDAYGNINYDALPAQKRAEVKRLLMETQPSFDRLNDDPPSRELLSEAEFDRYIEAQMLHSTVMARAGIDTSAGPADPARLSPELAKLLSKAQADLSEARQLAEKKQEALRKQP